jgi:hypothetical protein
MVETPEDFDVWWSVIQHLATAEQRSVLDTFCPFCECVAEHFQLPDPLADRTEMFCRTIIGSVLDQIRCIGPVAPADQDILIETYAAVMPTLVAGLLTNDLHFTCLLLDLLEPCPLFQANESLVEAVRNRVASLGLFDHVFRFICKSSDPSIYQLTALYSLVAFDGRRYPCDDVVRESINQFLRCLSSVENLPGWEIGLVFKSFFDVCLAQRTPEWDRVGPIIRFMLNSIPVPGWRLAFSSTRRLPI